MFSKSIRKTQIRKPSQLCYETASSEEPDCSDGREERDCRGGLLIQNHYISIIQYLLSPKRGKKPGKFIVGDILNYLISEFER